MLTLDLGTSYFKAAILHASGEILCLDRAPTPIVRDGVRSTIAPDLFVATVRESIRRLVARVPDAARRLRGVTFCTQANTFALLDRSGRTVTPLIVWNDCRAGSQCDALTERLASPAHRERSGLPGLSPYLAIAKLNWLRDVEPSAYASGHSLLFIGDYFTRWLTGEHVTDPSVAALTGLFDISTGEWSVEWCERANVDARWLPRVVAAGTRVGPIRREVAEELGIPKGVQFAAGLLDQYAGAVGVGNAAVGDVSETTGTVLATIRSSASSTAPTGRDTIIGPSPWKGRFYHMAVGDVSASLLDLYRRSLPDVPSFEELDADANASPSQLALDPSAPIDALRATVVEWAGRAKRSEAVAAIYRAVAESLRRQVASLTEEPPACVRSAGGASRSRRWLQVKADVLGVPMLEPATPEPTLLGAASLAAAAFGLPPIRVGDIDSSRLVRPAKASS